MVLSSPKRRKDSRDSRGDSRPRSPRRSTRRRDDSFDRRDSRARLGQDMAAPRGRPGSEQRCTERPTEAAGQTALPQTEAAGTSDEPGQGAGATCTESANGVPLPADAGSPAKSEPPPKRKKRRLFDMPPEEVPRAEPVGLPADWLPVVTPGPSCELDPLLDAASSLRRSSVAEVMVFCLEHAAQASSLAPRLVSRCLQARGPLGPADTACLFCVSDVLHNTAYAHRCPGANAYRAAFEDLLPRVFHRLYMGLLALPRAARSLEEARVKKLLQAWRDAEFYPTIYLDGLEAAAFAGALGTDLAMEPQSKELRMKLEAYAALDPLALERRCRNRGLWTHSGSDQLPPSKSTLLQRLQCFEVYWSGRASDPSKARTTDVSEREPTKEVMDDIDGTPVMDDIDGTPIQTPLFAELQQQRVLRNHPASAGGAISAAMTGWSWAEGVLPETAPISESPAPFQGCVDDDLDGEPIGVLELQQWRAARAAKPATPAPAMPEAVPCSLPPPPPPIPRRVLEESEAPNLGFDDAAIEALLSASKAAVVPASQPPAPPLPRRARPEMTAVPQVPEEYKGRRMEAREPSPLARRREPPSSKEQRKESRDPGYPASREELHGRKGRPPTPPRRRDRRQQQLDAPDSRNPSRQRGKSPRRRRREDKGSSTPTARVHPSLAGLKPLDNAQSAAAAAAAVAAAASAAAFLSARSRAVAPPQSAGEPGCLRKDTESPEPDTELDGDPLSSSDEDF